VKIQYIQPGEPNQNAYIERFNRTYRNELLDLYLFRNLGEVREATHWWKIEYNKERTERYRLYEIDLNEETCLKAS
jgi:putative transposase